MLMAVAGCKIHIGAPVGDGMSHDLAITGSADWAEIAEVESLGVLGTTWVTFAYTPESDQPEFSTVLKTGQSGQTLQIILGIVPGDEGQQRLWQAQGDIEDYAFRLDFPDGINRRLWRASVISFAEVFDEANSVMKIQADLQINSPITKETA